MLFAPTVMSPLAEDPRISPELKPTRPPAALRKRQPFMSHDAPSPSVTLARADEWRMRAGAGGGPSGRPKIGERLLPTSPPAVTNVAGPPLIAPLTVTLLIRPPKFTPP